MADDKRAEGEETITLPKRVLQEYVRQLSESVGKAREEMRNELNEFQKRPLKEYSKDFGEEMEKQIAAKIRAGAANNALTEILPEEIRNQRQFIQDLSSEIVRKQLPGIIDEVLRKEEARIDQRVADAVNRFDGVQPATVEETLRRKELKRKQDEERKRKNRRRNWILGIVGATGLAAAVGLSTYALIDSSRRTAESAAGVAQNANRTANRAANELAEHKDKYGKWVKKQDEQKKQEDEKRNSEISGLETRLTGKIEDKADKKVLDAQIADFKKNYESLDAELKKELAKNQSREEAYASYKKLADATKKSLDELAKNYDEFSKKTAAREQVDAEFERIGKNLADADANIKKYEGLVAQLQTESGANTKEGAELRKAYEELLKNYAIVTERVRKLEEKPAGNSNYQPPERDR